MKVIIAGSREIHDIAIVRTAMNNSKFDITEVVSGCARGVDKLGEKVATERGIIIKKFPADWSRGKGAGFERNFEMANYADALIAVWDGKSRGTKHMIGVAETYKLLVYVQEVSNAH